MTAAAPFGCGGSSASPTIAATPRDALLDAPPRVAVAGADGGATVRATTVDASGVRWTSTTAIADLRRDPTRPLWSMRGGRAAFFLPTVPAFDVRLDVMQGGRSVAHTTIRRRTAARGVRVTSVRDGLYGDLFEPSVTAPRRPAAIVIGGSEGGLVTGEIAALLASHGYPALALAYFKEPGLPSELKDIPLEYFARALRRLGGRPGVDPRRLVVVGASRGGEAALLIGATYPKLVHGAVALVPSNVVIPSPDGTSAAWTLDGSPLAHVTRRDFGNPYPTRTPKAVIAVEQIAGPILTAAAGADAVWPSDLYMTALAQRLDARHFRHRHEDLRFDDAGHAIGDPVPYLPTRTYPQFGGTAASDQRAKAALWPRILAFMAQLRGS